MLTGYEIQNGVIHQVEDFGERMVYDTHYIEKYRTLPVHEMSVLRWQLIGERLIYDDLETPLEPHVLDFGCGLGTFLQVACAGGAKVFGFDIVSDYPLAPEIERVTTPFDDYYHIVTFFDCLEHLLDPVHTLQRLRTDIIVISVPWCHAHTLGDSWFNAWKHRKPGEHLWHFDAASLCKLMALVGFKPIFIGNPEDRIRRPVEALPNILTGVFVKT